MQLFLKKVLLFAILFLAASYCLQGWIVVRTANKTFFSHDNLEHTANKNAQIVMVGGSRCGAHFDPLFFQNTYKFTCINLGVDGHSEVLMSLARLKDYLTENQNPRFVVLSFDPFVSKGTAHTNVVHKDYFAHYAFVPFNAKWNTIGFFDFSLYEKYIPLFAIFKYKQMSYCLLNHDSTAYMKYGYDRHDVDWDTIQYPVKNNLQRYYFTDSSRSEVKSGLDSLNRFCKARNITLVCMQTPVYKNIYNESVFKSSAQVCAELNIPFIDANTDLIRNESSNFYNSNHLNTTGVSKMNRFLKEDSTLFKIFK